MKTSEIINIMPERLCVANLPYGELYIKRMYSKYPVRKFKAWYATNEHHPQKLSPVFRGEDLRGAILGLYQWCIRKGYIEQENTTPQSEN